MKCLIKYAKNKYGFTMLELLMVVIIIGILATLALPQYMSFIEKARAAEAMSTMGSIRTAESLYKLESGSYTATIGNLAITLPVSGYWSYSVSGASDSSFTMTATRTAKKASGNVIGQTIVLTWDDNTGESWSGSHIGVPR